jgi:hypothetical protein
VTVDGPGIVYIRLHGIHIQAAAVSFTWLCSDCRGCDCIIYSAKKDKDHIFSEVLKNSSLYLKVVLLLIWSSIHQ